MFVRHGHCVKTRPTSRPTALKAVQWTMLACWAILAETWGLVFSPRAIMARLELHGQPGFESQSETQGLNISYSWMFFFLSSSPVISPVSVSAQKPTEHLLIYLLYTHVSCLRGVWPASWQVTCRVQPIADVSSRTFQARQRSLQAGDVCSTPKQTGEIRTSTLLHVPPKYRAKPYNTRSHTHRETTHTCAHTQT